MRGNALGSTTNEKNFYPGGQIALFKGKEYNKFTVGKSEISSAQFCPPERQTVKYPLSFEHLIIKLEH